MEGKQIVEHKESGSIVAIIEAAVKSGMVDATVIHSLLDANERWMKTQAEIEFNEAFTRLSQKLPRIVKKGSVTYKDKQSGKNEEAFKFATYDTIDEAVRTLLSGEGFSLLYDTKEREGGGLIMTATLLHVKGHSRQSSISLDLDSSGGKNKIQAMGSSSSYGRRYAMCNILNIVTVGEDDDANSAFPITTEQAVELDLKLTESGIDRIKFMKVLKVGDLRDLRVKDYGRAMNTVKAKIYDNEKSCTS